MKAPNRPAAAIVPALLAGILLCFSFQPRSARAQITPPPGSLDVDFLPDNQWRDCPAGSALVGVRVTRYSTTNKNVNHIVCKPVANLTGPITIKTLNVDTPGPDDMGAGYNECPAGQFIVGVYKRRINTPDKQVTRIKCQAISGASATAKPDAVFLIDGTPYNDSLPPKTDGAWGYCPNGGVAIGIGTVHYDGGNPELRETEVQNMIAHAYAQRAYGSPQALDWATVGIIIYEAGVKKATSWVVDKVWSAVQGWLEDLWDWVQGGFDNDEFNFTERWLACGPPPSCP